MNYDLTIFDCNGVILDDELKIKQVLVFQLAVRGYEMTMDFARKHLIGVSNDEADRIIEAATGYRPDKKFWEDARAGVRTMFDEAARETTCGKPHPFLMPDVVQLIESLDTKKKCIVSNNTESMLKHCLRQVGLWHSFRDATYFPANGLRGKPFPDLLYYAASKANVPSSKCLVIEDGIPGVKAAVNAGMTVWGFAGGSHCAHDVKAYAKELRNAGASKVYGSMHDIGKALCQRPGVPTFAPRVVGAEIPIL